MRPRTGSWCRDLGRLGHKARRHRAPLHHHLTPGASRTPQAGAPRPSVINHPIGAIATNRDNRAIASSLPVNPMFASITGGASS